MSDGARAAATPPGEGGTLKEGGEQQQQLQAKTEGHAAAAASEGSLREFGEIVAPLEKASGKPLGGPGLERCRTAFQENPHGFRVCATDALQRALSPLGLLIRMVSDGDHRDVAPAAAPSSTKFHRAEGWVRNAGWQLELDSFNADLAHRDLDDLERQRLTRLYEQLRADAGEGAQ